MACLFDVASVIEMHVHIVQIHICLFVYHWSSVVSTQGWHVCTWCILVYIDTAKIIECAGVSFRLFGISDESELQILEKKNIAYYNVNGEFNERRHRLHYIQKVDMSLKTLQCLAIFLKMTDWYALIHSLRIRELYSRYFSYYYNKDHEKN